MNNIGEANNSEVAVIPKGTVINGNVSIEGKLEMHGVVNGDIESDSRVNICGNVTGNIKAKDLYSKDSFIVGRIDCEQSAQVRENTIILGDINANSLEVDGAIQGKLDIKDGIIIGDKAIIDSDIKAKTIQVSNGAAINGTCSLCYANVNVKDFFPEKEETKTKETKTKEADAE